jgi:WD40 repeat protein/DNA-binding XRE family transcriptional regulator
MGETHKGKQAQEDFVQKASPNIRLREYRMQRLMTQAQLADAVGVSEITVGRWERGEAQPGSYALKKLCTLFDTTPQALGFERKPVAVPTEPAAEEPPAAPSIPDTTTPSPQPFWRSRRSLIIGGSSALAAGLALGGFLFWSRASTSNVHPTPGPVPTPTTVKPTLQYSSHRALIRCIAWSPDDRYVVSGDGKGMVLVWNPGNGHDALVDNCHKDEVNVVVWSPDKQYIASAGRDLNVQIRPAFPVQATSQPACYASIIYTNHSKSVRALAWSPDSQYIASGGIDQTLHVWSISSKQLLFPKKEQIGEVKGVEWSHNGKYFAFSSADHRVRICDAQSGDILFTYQGHQDEANTVAWSPDDRYIASSGNDGTVHVWEAFTQNKVIYREIKGEVETVAWSPDGRYLASGGEDKLIRVWLPHTSQTLLTCVAHTSKVYDVEWAHQGYRLGSAGKDQRAYIWELGEFLKGK